MYTWERFEVINRCDSLSLHDVTLVYLLTSTCNLDLVIELLYYLKHAILRNICIRFL